MATQYPNAIDSSTTLPLVFDNITDVDAASVNRLRYAVIAVETALGINPQGSFTSTGGVSARFADLDVQITNLNTSVANVVSEVEAIIATFDGEAISLGTPTDGFLTGITDLTNVDKITETLNTFNNIMFYLAPAQAQSMEGLAIEAATSIPIVTGANIKVADVTGHAAGYFKTGLPAGSGNYRITKTQSFTLTTHTTGDSTTGFSDADKGIIVVLVNNAGVTTFNLGTAFDEANRAVVGGQGISYASGTGSASAPLKTVDSHTQVYSIALFNSFPLWQKGVIRITNTTLTPGYNSFQIVHTVGSTPRSSQLYELFYDNGSSTPSFPLAPTLGISSGTSYNYLSGVKYLTTGNTLVINATINNAFVNTYLQIPISYTFTAGIVATTSDLSDPLITVGPTGTSAAPNSTDHITVAKTFDITVVNQQTISQIATVTYSNVYGTSYAASSVTQNMLVNTYNSAVSTSTAEYFLDENRRLKPNIDGATTTPAAYPNDYVTVPPITGQWTASAALINGNAQSYNGALVFPAINFTSGYVPAQGGSTNYSGFNTGQVYYRAMYSAGNPRSNGTLTIGGIVLTDLTQFSPILKVEIKLPGATGWLDMSLPFDSGTFTGAYGQGCRTGYSSNQFGWSVGTNSTSTSGYLYILRITLLNSAKQITLLSESFVQTF